MMPIRIPTVSESRLIGWKTPSARNISPTMKYIAVRHIMGFMKPDKGSVKINGLDTWKEQGKVQSYVGYLPGEISFFEGMTGKTFLDFMADMQGVKDLSKRTRLIDRLQFDVHTPIRKMSKGMKQKVGIVATFMHDPDVIT
jgi:ABC-2 type transport system ATP-binding protein